MRRVKGKAPIVQTGDVKTIIATGVIAVDRGDGFVDVTFCHDHNWGGPEVQEREISGLLHMTKCCWEEFRRIVEALGMGIELEELPLFH